MSAKNVCFKIGHFYGSLFLTLALHFVCPLRAQAAPAGPLNCKILMESLAKSKLEPQPRTEFESSSKAGVRLTQQARRVRNLDDFLNLASAVPTSAVTEAEGRLVFKKINRWPSFLNQGDLLDPVFHEPASATSVRLKNEIVSQAVVWLQEGGDYREIKTSKFLTTPMKILVFDLAALPAKMASKKNISSFRQTAIWECEDNVILKSRRTSFEIQFPILQLAQSAVTIQKTETTSPELMKLFLHGNSVLLPMNPLNQSLHPIFQGEQNFHGEWGGFFSASRSVFFERQDLAFSIKMPSDYTNPIDFNHRKPNKADLQEDIVQGLSRSRWIEKVDQNLGLDSRLIVLKESFAIVDPSTGNGLLVRDLSALLGNKFFLPGTATVSVFQKLGAQELHKALIQSASNQGQAQALFLLRYGLQMEFPHRQNSLDQLDSELNMTETSAIRDVGDSRFVELVAKVIAPEALLADLSAKIKTFRQPKPNILFVTTLENNLSAAELVHLEQVLTASYYTTIARELGLPLGFDFNSTEFSNALRRYHQKKKSTSK